MREAGPVGTAPGLDVPVPVTPHPPWLDRLAKAAQRVAPEYFGRALPPREGGRKSAVLILFGPHPEGGEDVVLTHRSNTLRSHAGQISFPGGRLDPTDAGPVPGALREAHEEIGLDIGTVRVVTQLPELYINVSASVVTPVVAWWERPMPLSVRSPAEVAQVDRVPLARLTTPRHRFTAVHPSGYHGPAFAVDDMLIWGFTANVLTTVFDLAGLEEPWDDTVQRTLPDHFFQRLPRPAVPDGPRRDHRNGTAGRGEGSPSGESR